MYREVKNGLYRHYKGGEYRVVAEALMESDGTQVVLYRPAKDGLLAQDIIFVRPSSEFKQKFVFLEEG